MPSILRNEEAVRKAVSQSNSIRECLVALGLRGAGGNYKALRQACERIGIDVPVCTGDNQTATARNSNRIPLEEILVEHSSYTNRAQLKKKLVSAGLLEWRCHGKNCTVVGEWNGEPIMLQLEHINGTWNDNRIENLTFLCPNCHSQTETYAGRSLKRS